MWGISSTAIETAAVTASAMLLAMIGLFALLRRGHWLTTLLFSSAFLALAAFEIGTLGAIQAGSEAAAHMWASYLARNSAMVSWLWLTLSVVLGRSDPRQNIRNAGAYLTLSLIGCVVLAWAAGTPSVVKEVVGRGGESFIVFGQLGKIYLMYLVVAMIAVLMNLESMQRNAPAQAQKRLRPLFLAILIAILVQLMVVSGGLLYGGLRVRWMASSAPLLFCAGAAAALALARRRLSDLSVPVARPVIYYSSVSLTLAGTFLLSMAVLSRLLPAMSSQWKLGVTLAFLAFVGGGGLLLMVSPRTSRAIKRFVDRNFYANRYDYRREWERVTSSLAPTANPGEVAAQIERLVCGVFDATAVAIHMKEPDGGVFVKRLGPAGVAERIPAAGALVAFLSNRPPPVVFRELENDLDHIALLIECRPTVEAARMEVCAPLAVGKELIGLLWVSGKRGGDPWSLEDVEFLASMSHQLAAALWFSQQSEIAVEKRQLESLHRLSSFVLHDIKNQVSGLSLVVENAKRHLGNPEFQRDAMAVVERTVLSLRELMNQVSGVGRTLAPVVAPCSLHLLVDQALLSCGMAAGGETAPRLTVRVGELDEAVIDAPLMQRVVINLLTNAREAVDVDGRITLDVGVTGTGAASRLQITVEDNGRGMTDEYVRTRLFRPFATTKTNGLGIGLAQCRAIVEAHGGSIDVRSRPGEGTKFLVSVPVGAGVVPAMEGERG